MWHLWCLLAIFYHRQVPFPLIMKVQVYWSEITHYTGEIEIPDNLSKEEELNWVRNNTNEWEMDWREPDVIDIYWDTFYVEEVQ